ncbi:MAG: prolipoprotein diacylglyceryl transferase [Clostridia bacterium]|nr:prolipoprotein diacylglyceryl transferase [Clostridia bacterium]
MSMKKELYGAALTLVLCLAVALGALALVPSSPALLLEYAGTPEEFAAGEATAVAFLKFDTGLVDVWDEPVPLMVTGYGVWVAVGSVLAVIAMAVLARVRGLRMEAGASAGALCGLGALLGGHWMYCAVRWSYIINDLAGNWSFPLQLWQGGFTMYGAILGGLLGGVLAAKMTRMKLAPMLDMVVIGALLVMLCGRCGEGLTSQGLANIRAAEALNMLPFTDVDEWGDPVLRVYAYEALAAAAALAAAGVVLALRKPAGRAAEVGLAIVSAYQLLFESMRGDELIRFGFVCLNMIAAAAVLAFILVTRIIRRVRLQGWKAWETIRVVLFALGCGIVICTEFALDGKIKLPGVNATMLYAVDALAVTGMMLAVAIADGRKETA